MKKIKDSISLVRIRKFVRDSEWIALSRLKRINDELQFDKMMFRDDNRIKEYKVSNLSSL